MKIFQSIIAIICALIIFQNAAHCKTKVNKIGFTNSNRLYVEINEKTKYKVFTLKKPNRIVVDIYDSNITGLKKPKYIKNVKQVRFSCDSKKSENRF